MASALSKLKDMLDGLRVQRMGIQRNWIRISFAEEFGFDVRIGRVLQQIHKTGHP